MNEKNIEQVKIELADTSLKLFSRQVSPELERMIAYLTPAAANPDKYSEFKRKNSDILHHFINGVENAKTGFMILKEKNYDFLLADWNNGLPKNGYLGFTAYQINDGRLYVFAINVPPKYQRNGIALHMQKGLLEIAREKNISDVRISEGNNEKVNGILAKLKADENTLNISVLDGGWIKLL